MAQDFDSARAAKIKEDILRDVRVIRDMLSKEIIDYYWDMSVRDEADFRKFKDGVRNYARRAANELDAVIRDTE